MTDMVSGGNIEAQDNSEARIENQEYAHMKMVIGAQSPKIMNETPKSTIDRIR